MALSVGDIISIADVQTFLGQTLINQYFYEVESFDTGVTLEDLAQAWETQVLLPVRAFQSVLLTHVTSVSRNLTNGLDIWEEPTGQVGSVGGPDAESSFYALGFRLIRTTAATRHGSKRIGGLPGDISTSNSLTAGYTTNVNAAAAAMGAAVEVTGGMGDLRMIPVIVGRFPEGDPNAGELDLSVINPVSAAQFVRVTTQNSRKAGRGI